VTRIACLFVPGAAERVQPALLEIALTMEYEQAIAAHESRRAAEMPWLT